MSYRHSSYRKLSRAITKAAERGEQLTPAEMGRVMHWSNRPPLPKPANWGVPRRRRAA